jgi:hypothetical protein
MVGTNNHGDSAADIAEGVKTICNLIRDKQPQAYLVVLVIIPNLLFNFKMDPYYFTMFTKGLLPRGQNPSALRTRNAEVNALVSEQLKGNSRAQLIDVDSTVFVLPDGTINHHDMYDYLHLTQKGYEKAFEQVGGGGDNRHFRRVDCKEYLFTAILFGAFLMLLVSILYILLLCFVNCNWFRVLTIQLNFYCFLVFHSIIFSFLIFSGRRSVAAASVRV